MFTPLRSYSVRTTYHFVVEDILNTTHLKVDGNWKAIWNLKVPPKLKQMLWRSLRVCLPTRQRLISRVVQCLPSCCFYENQIENEWHIFISCAKVQQLWKEAKLTQHLQLYLDTTEGYNELVFGLFNSLSPSILSKIIVVLLEHLEKQK